MQKIKILDRVTITSDNTGGEKEAFVASYANALAAKSASVYVMVHEVDSNCRLAIAYRHSPDGENWADGDNDLFDTGASNDAKEGMQVSASAEDVVRVDQIGIIPKLQERTSPSTLVTATISVWLVLKPF